MRAVVQRVKEAYVTVAGEEKGCVNKGLLVYLGIGDTDSEKDLTYLANKVAGLRIFADANGAMNRSVTEIDGGALVISQFTLYGDVRRGKRPSFTKAMHPERAEQMYLQFILQLEKLGVPCAQGVFGAMMEIHSTNDGPVTILIDSHKNF